MHVHGECHVPRLFRRFFQKHFSNGSRPTTVMKRARDVDPGNTTEVIVDAALKEEQRARRELVAARGRVEDRDGPAPRDPDAFLSDSDVEEDREAGNGAGTGLYGDDDIADTEEERARRAQAIKETARSMREAEEAFDDDLEQQKKLQEDHGFQIEAFNMREERENGTIDGEGNFVRGPRVDGEDEDGEEDGWLDGNQDKLVVDDATREKIETRKEEDVEKVAGPAELARWQYRIYQVLESNETVARALKRLGGGSQRRFVSAAARKRMERANKGVKQQSEEDRRAFEEVTECATLLMNQGDTDVYGRDRAYFKRAASLFIDVSGDEGDEGDEGGEGDDDDMFA